MKPKLTQQEREKAITDLKSIITDAGLIDECHEIVWDDILQLPKISPDIAAKIKGKYFHRYVSLMNRLK